MTTDLQEFAASVDAAISTLKQKMPDQVAGITVLAAAISASEAAFAESIPPPAASPSPDGTVILSTKKDSIVDLNGSVWTFGSGNTQYGSPILKDGSQYKSGQAVKLVFNGGSIWALNGTNQWWKDTGDGWTLTSNPFQVVPVFPPVTGIPAQTAEAGFNVKTFSSGPFPDLSKIDVSDTLGQGFDWYPHQNGKNVPGYVTTPPSEIAAVNGMLSLKSYVYPDGSSGILGLMTVAQIPGNPNPLNTLGADGTFVPVPASFVGRLFNCRDGFLVDAQLSIDKNPNGRSGWPAVWSMGATNLAVFSYDHANWNSHFIELDLFEFMNGSPIFTIHDWQNSSARGGNPQNDFNSDNGPIADLSAVDWSNFNLKCRHRSTKNTGDKGEVCWWINDILVKQITYDQAATYSVIETGEIGFILGAGNQWPINVGHFNVWQKSMSEVRIGAG